MYTCTQTEVSYPGSLGEAAGWMNDYLIKILKCHKKKTRNKWRISCESIINAKIQRKHDIAHSKIATFLMANRSGIY